VHTPEELKSRLWKALSSDRTLMLGLRSNGGHLVPMTAQVEHERAPVWIFSSVDNALVEGSKRDNSALASFASKGHELFAMLHGSLQADNDPVVIDRLWNPFVAAWYKGGKSDPSLVLLRFDLTEAQVWLAETGLLTGLKLLLGADPQREFADRQARVSLR
jgi:general stress protein 26